MSFEHKESKQLESNTLLILFSITDEFTTLGNCLLKVLSFLLYLKILNEHVKSFCKLIHCYDYLTDKVIASCLGSFCASALVTFGKTVAIICKHLVVWQYAFLGHLHFRGTFLLFEDVSLSICWQSLSSSGPPLTSQKLSLSPVPSYFLRASLFFHCQVSGQVTLCCECGNCPYSLQQRCNLY